MKTAPGRPNAIALDRPAVADAWEKFARPTFIAFAVLLTGALAIVVYVVPLNANDMLKHLLRFEGRSAWDFAAKHFVYHPTSTDWRPLQLPFGHVLYTLSNGHEHLVFKGLLVASLIGTTWLFVRVLAVRSWIEAISASVALLILFGHHSFAGAVEGVYPWGVEIVLVACQIAVLGILLRERTLASEVSALAISVFALVLNEKGGAVGATYIVGGILQMPGGSIRGAACTFAAYIGVLAVRFIAFRNLFAVGGKREGANSYLFDSVAPMLNLLISDPQYNEFVIFSNAWDGKSGAVIIVISSVATTALIVAWAIAQRKRPEAGLFVLLIIALLTTIIFGPFSQKNYIPILALAVYAVAAFYALRWLFHAQPGIAVGLACVLFVTWAIRFGALGYHMAELAHKYQEEWREAEVWGHAEEHDPRMAGPIIARLRDEALSRTFPHPARTVPEFWKHLLQGR
jgi:hypothetical protein